MKRNKRAGGVTRRAAFAAFAGAAGAAACSSPDAGGAAPPYAGVIAFAHGVASGDPGADRLVIWTRVSPDTDGPVPVTWMVADDPDMTKIVRQGFVSTDATRDYTVKVDVEGLKAGRVYHYGFKVGGAKSPVGRGRTLPRGKVSSLVIAAVSCSNYSSGFFNAYEALAKRADVHFVLHLGDYIYEYALGQYGTENAAALGRLPDPLTETVTLPDYRARYAKSRTDPDLQAAHAAFPFIHVWDDHEVTNDAWTGGAANHNPENGEGDYAARRDAAVRAFYEWVPIRDPEPAKSFLAINRSFQFGDLATIIMLETRLLARTQQLDPVRDLTLISTLWDLTDPGDPKPAAPGAPQPARTRMLPTPFDMRGAEPRAIVDYRRAVAMDPAKPPKDVAFLPDIEAFKRRLDDPGRMLLGPDQEKWLDAEIYKSVRAGAVWQVLGNQTLMGKIRLPARADIGAPGVSALREKFPRLLAALELEEKGVPAATLDSWDGYPAQRARLMQMFANNDANIVVLSGDSHQSWAIELMSEDGKTRLADEFGVTSISSPGIGELLGAGGADLAKLLVEKSPEVKWADPLSHGFVSLTLTRDAAKAEFVTVSTVASKAYQTRTAAVFETAPVKGPQVGALTKAV
ncbi:MAG: alkaline phosphatase [Hyphomonadaceae bacterium]